MNQLNAQSLIRLKKNDDGEITELVKDTLQSFSDYHAAIYKLENVMTFLDSSDNDVQQTIEQLAQHRTRMHNSVITYIKIMNRICSQQSIPLIYEGVVSEERPYRTELADAVLGFVETVVKNRQKGI